MMNQFLLQLLLAHSALPQLKEAGLVLGILFKCFVPCLSRKLVLHLRAPPLKPNITHTMLHFTLWKQIVPFYEFLDVHVQILTLLNRHVLSYHWKQRNTQSQAVSQVSVLWHPASLQSARLADEEERSHSMNTAFLASYNGMVSV